MKFKLYLTEGRSKAISMDQAVSLLKSNCKKAIEAWNHSSIYRGLASMSNPFLYIDPKKSESRQSANTTNYYTFINDNSPKWKQYPKRSQSIICTTNVKYTLGYGNSYAIFPYDNAKIGICPKPDYWNSFMKGLNTPFIDMDEWNRSLVTMFDVVNVPINDDSFMNIKNSFKMFDAVIKNDNSVLEEILKESKYKWMHEYNGNLMEYIQYILSPNINKFKLIKIGQPINCDNCEVWTDSKSIMVEWDHNDDKSNNILKLVSTLK